MTGIVLIWLDILIEMLRQWLPEYDLEAYDDYLEHAFVLRFQFIGQLFVLLTIKPLTDVEFNPLHLRYMVDLHPDAATMLHFSFHVV